MQTRSRTWAKLVGGGQGPCQFPKTRRESKLERKCVSLPTLAARPTATATRSFGHEKRIHSLQRANLLLDGVRKMVFCQWNSRVLRGGADKNEAYLRRQFRKTSEQFQKFRFLPANITESHVSRPAAAISPIRSDSYSIMPRSSHPSEDLPPNGATSYSRTKSRDDKGNEVLVPEMIPMCFVLSSIGLRCIATPPWRF